MSTLVIDVDVGAASLDLEEVRARAGVVDSLRVISSCRATKMIPIEAIEHPNEQQRHQPLVSRALGATALAIRSHSEGNQAFGNGSDDGERHTESKQYRKEDVGRLLVGQPVEWLVRTNGAGRLDPGTAIAGAPTQGEALFNRGEAPQHEERPQDEE